MPAGRKRKTVDWVVFDKLCAIQCTRKELANFFCMDEDTIQAIVKREKGCDFSAYYDQKSVPGKISIRRKQFQIAENGHVAMLIWLGKQWLGQSEKIESKELQPIKLAYDPNSDD